MSHGELEQLRAQIISLRADQNALQADMHRFREEINRKVESLTRSERRARRVALDAIETTRRVLKEKEVVTAALEREVGQSLEGRIEVRLATMGLRKREESR